jgi:hypothetical protein
LQPNVTSEAAMPKNRPARYSDRETAIILFLLQNGIPVFDPHSSTS